VSPTPASEQRKPRSIRWILHVGSMAAALLFAAFLVGIVGMFRPTAGGLDNWLIILFNLNFRPASTPPAALSSLSSLDIALMLLVAVVIAAMYPAIISTSRAWATIAIALPILGIPIFLATATAGRSAVLLAGLISSILALRSRFGSPVSAYAGILGAAFLLFLGDFGTAAFAPSLLVAIFIAVGYILWTIWILLLSLEFLRRSRLAAA
jgi:hypothetical protein